MTPTIPAIRWSSRKLDGVKAVTTCQLAPTLATDHWPLPSDLVVVLEQFFGRNIGVDVPSSIVIFGSSPSVSCECC